MFLKNTRFKLIKTFSVEINNIKASDNDTIWLNAVEQKHDGLGLLVNLIYMLSKDILCCFVFL